MKQVKAVYSLPRDAAGYDDMSITATAVALSVGFSYGPRIEGNRCLIEFTDVLAFRFCDEMHCTIPDGIAGSVCEIVGSDWLRDLRDQEPPGVGGIDGKSHFGLLLIDDGYLEVVAESLSVRYPVEK